MKKMKKILAFVMAMAMVLGMSVTALAATPADGEKEFGKKGDMGSILIKGIAQEEGIEIALYPVVEAIYNEDTDVFEKYEVVKKADGDPLYDLEKDADGNYVINTQQALDTIGTTAQTSGIALANIEWEYDAVNGGYKTKTDSVPVGTYLALITGAETKIYNYAVVSLYYTVKDGKNEVEGGALELKNAESIVKVSEHPDVEKTAKDSDGKVVPSADIGDEISYTLKITDVPYYGGETPVLNLVDTLSTGLTFQDNVVVKTTDATGTEKTLIENTDYTVTTYEEVSEKEEDDKTKEEKALTAGQILINFVVDGKYMLNPYAGKTVTVTYSAILNENAVINEEGNTNGVVLNYTKDSKVNSDDVTDTTEEKKTYTYTFDIDGAVSGSVTEGIVTKTGEYNETTKSNALNGAIFTLYTKNPDSINDEESLANAVYKNYKFKEDGSKVELFGGTVESQNGGQLPIKGLAEGTYYLKETTAPEGYSLNTHVFEIVIQGTYERPDDTENKGKLESWTITIDGNTTNTFTVDEGNVTINKGVTVDGESVEGEVIGTDIPNTKLSSLPSTGGIGTTIFTIGGCAIMIIAAGLYFASRRKSAK